MADHSEMKLGRRAILPHKAARLLRMARYLPADLPVAPRQLAWSKAVASWPMFGNDVLGDCTAAGYAHMLEAWTANVTGSPLNLTEFEVESFYAASTGWDGTPETDQGGDEISVLNYARSAGLAAQEIKAYVSVDPTNIEHVLLGQYLFGGLYLGIALPLSAQTQDVWDAVPDWEKDGMAGSWGGHCVPILDYDRDAQEFVCVTWGATKRMSFRFFQQYCEEAYALLSPLWIGSDGFNPSHFNMAQLEADLRVVTG